MGKTHNKVALIIQADGNLDQLTAFGQKVELVVEVNGKMKVAGRLNIEEFHTFLFKRFVLIEGSLTPRLLKLVLFVVQGFLTLLLVEKSIRQRLMSVFTIKGML